MKKDVAVSSLFLSKFTKKFFTKFQIKKFAFTLAETLVVMGIIGVVAALTIPNLNQSTGDREKVAKVKKIYSELNDALGRATAVYGPIDEWCGNEPKWTCNKKFAERLKDFLKLSKDCNTGRGCFTDNKITFLNGEVSDNYPETCSSSCNKFILQNGISISTMCHYTDFSDNTLSDDLNSPARNRGFVIDVDIDGPNKGSLTYGKDYFGFWVTKSGIVPGCIPFSNCGDDIVTSCFQKGHCTGWVIETGNMDYLKADRNGKCPNGTQLSWENTRCK